MSEDILFTTNLKVKTINQKTHLGNLISLRFNDGPRIQIDDPPLKLRSRAKPKTKSLYRIKFADKDTGIIIYESIVESDHWAEAGPKYFVNWLVTVEENGVPVFRHELNLKGQTVLIQFESSALGDSIAWFPYAEEFAKKHQCRVHVAGFHNYLFKKNYPDIKFYEPKVDNVENDYYAVYKIGAFDNNYNKNRNHWRLIPMQQIPTDILGLPKMEVRPRIVKSELSRPVEGRYVAISEFSTFEGKLWSYVGGWDEIVKYLHSLGYKVVSISKEPTRLKNVIAMNDRPIEESIRNLQYADFFIGVASGAMWLAWGLGLPVVVISGFTMPYSEMKEDCYRVINDQVCTGCYNDTTTTFDRNNWRWCPRGKNYECSTSITPDSVKVVIDRLMQDKGFEKSAEITSLDELRPKRVLFLSPHCSTGGLPQYMYQLISSLKEGGHDIEVIEYTNLSDTWVVQKNKIKQLCTIHTLNGDKPAQIEQIISEFDPDVIHLQEFPENWLDEKSCSYLYREKHPYKIIETSHGSEFDPQNKQYRPDGFCFVGKFHAKQYQKFGVPTKIIEYQTIPHSRPDRTEALINIGLDPSKKHILNVGLFAPHKNQGEIFAIARKLPDCLFHFIGNQADNFRPYWEPLLADKPKNCIIWGEQEDVDSFYGAMDLFLFTSIKETNPLVVKEALSWQMPVMMKKLPTYMGDYNNQPKVIFINNNIDKTISLIRKIFPSVLDDIENIYGFKA